MRSTPHGGGAPASLIKNRSKPAIHPPTLSSRSRSEFAAASARRAASSSPSSPREERAGRGPRRGETNKNAPPLPSPLLHPMEEREKSRTLMQPCCVASPPCLKRPTQLHLQKFHLRFRRERHPLQHSER